MRQEISAVPKTEYRAKLAVLNRARGARAAPYRPCCLCPGRTPAEPNPTAPGTAAEGLGWGVEALLSRGEAARGSVAHAAASRRLVGVPLPPSSLAEHCTEEPGAGGAPREWPRPSGHGTLLLKPGGQGQRDPEVPSVVFPAWHPLHGVPCPACGSAPCHQPCAAAAAAGRGWISSLAD